MLCVSRRRGRLTRVTWYSAPSTYSELGASRAFFNTANTLAELDDVDDWLGRTHWTTNSTANASYNEVRIWDGALTPADLDRLHAAGPDM